MAKVSFVGFQEKVEIPEGFELLEVSDEIPTNLHKDQLFSLLSEPIKISEWFYKVHTFDSRPGGKVDFLDLNGAAAQAVCTSFVLGKEISLVADLFGNFKAKVVKGKESNFLNLHFSILTNDAQSKSEELLTLVNRLRELVA